MWKNIHNAYRIGNKWASIPNYEQRALCSLCGAEESMEHILLECTSSPAIHTIWSLAKRMWELCHDQWPIIRFGTIMGAGLAAFTRPPRPGDTTPPQPLHGKNRLFAILTSESAHIIWKLRCDRLLRLEDDPERRHSVQEIQNRWMLSLNNRLKTDIIQTNKTKYGALALPETTVLTTWSGILQDNETLPTNC